MQQNESSVDHFLTPYTKIRQFKDISLRHETIRLLEKDIAVSPLTYSIAIFLGDLSHQARATKAE